MDFADVFEKERATRKFSSKKIDEQLIAEIIKKAQQSPSLLNSQPWKAYVITGDALSKLRKENKTRVEKKIPANEDFSAMLSIDWSTFASQNMSNMGAFVTYFLHNRTELFNDANKNMFDAPYVIYLTIPKKSPLWSVFDLGIFAQSIMLLAINHGISTMPAHSLVAYPDLIRKYTGINDDEAIGMAIGLGYSDKSAEVNASHFIPKRVQFDKIYKLIK
ncbi:nitroreductase [Lactobacillus psittaci]|uniref:Nitroreductase n=1 Tax=Lactobacillus psittaci DSM 15354 TaxID=1122152 RepID=A0A0R1S472_9LACO|nr:nitroreductase [Lactobacillus psittaci]KRL63823.1 nitroreductase [Lactobacillus psittaci DSM 15354]